MKSFTLFPVLFFLVACSSGTPEYDATGTFEATDVVVSAEASGKILGLDVEEGTVLKAGQEAGIIDSILARRLAGETLSEHEVAQFKTAVLVFLGAEYILAAHQPASCRCSQSETVG